MAGVPAAQSKPQIESEFDLLLERYASVRATTMRLAHPLSAEDQMVQSMGDASPTKWHLAHTTWFVETFILTLYARAYQVFDPRFTFLFNSYYKQLDGHPDRAVRGSFSRPTLGEIEGYRAHVDAAIGRLGNSEKAREVQQLLELGMNHEQQHQELIVTDIKHAFWTNPLRPAYQHAPTQPAKASAQPIKWIAFEPGLGEIGHEGRGFSFDNELPRHRVYMQRFELASRLVTNAEYLEFMADGGYRRPELWLSDGWDHIRAKGLTAPMYWEEREGNWEAFTCHGVRPLDSNQPVCHVSFYEAEAFARWAGARLPTEFEWEMAAASLPMAGNLLESGNYHPLPANSDSGLQQMFGDVWEWTASSYSPYPGYRAAEGVLGEYNGKFMCNQMVLRGGSCVTPQSHIRNTYRNFFPPVARWQFSGIRLAR